MTHQFIAAYDSSNRAQFVDLFLQAGSGSLAYSLTNFTEAAANDGSITATSTITLTGDTFTGSNGSNLGAVTNVPTGLTASLVRASSTTATLSFTGNASAHESANNITNLTVTFANGDFTGGNASVITGATTSNLQITFTDAATANGHQFVPAYDSSNRAQFVDLYDGAAPSGDTTILHDVPNGNISPTNTVLTGASTSTPSVTVEHETSIHTVWRHITFAANNLSGKTFTVTLNRDLKDGKTQIDESRYKLVYTTDYITWVQADTMAFNGGSTGTIVATFNNLPSGTITFATSPHMRVSDSTALANDLLTNYSSVASPTTSANASGVYHTTQAANNAYGTPAGQHPQYAIKLVWPDATNDGFPKRDLVILAGIHAAGEQQSSILFREFVYWVLNDTGTDANAVRDNWNIHLYFLLNPNGYQGGEHRYTINHGTGTAADPNRVWNPSGSSSTPVIDEVQTALQADLPSGADLLWSAHGDVYTTADFQMWAVSDEVSVPRSAAMQEMVDQGTTIFGQVPTISSVSTRNTDVSWAIDVLGTKTSMDTEIAAAAGTTVAYYRDLAVKWFQTLAAADAQGVFASAFEGVGSATGTSTVNGVSDNAGTNPSVGSAAGSSTVNGVSTTAGSNPSVGNASGTSTVTGVAVVTVKSVGSAQGTSSAIAFSNNQPPVVASTESGLVFLYDDSINKSTLTATSTATGFILDDLKSNNYNDIWMSSNLSDQVVTATWTAFQAIDFVAIPFSNLVAGSSFRVRTYLTSGSSTPSYDSGFIDVTFAIDPPLGFDTIGYKSFAYGGGNHLSHLFDEQQAQKIDVTFRSAGNPDGAIQASRIMAGKSIRLERGASYGANVIYEDDTDITRTDGGSPIPDIKSNNKGMEFEIKYMPDADKKKLSSMTRRTGKRAPVFASLRSNVTDQEEKQHFEAFGRIVDDGLTRASYDLDTTKIRLIQ